MSEKSALAVSPNGAGGSRLVAGGALGEGVGVEVGVGVGVGEGVGEGVAVTGGALL